MLALEVRLLTGRYVATHFNDRGRGEWPPHPARVYSALVAALHDESEPPDDERAALEWLAEAPPPEVVASDMVDVTHRQQSVVYVPTNDASALASIDGAIAEVDEAEAALTRADAKHRAKAMKGVEKAWKKVLERSAKSAKDDGKGASGGAKQLLPAGRSRQPRTFPVVVPDEDVIYFRWSVEPPADLRDALDRVAARVARLGHSSSLVTMRLVDHELDLSARARWTPDEAGSLLLRGVAPGQLGRLEAAHARHQQVGPRQLSVTFVAYDDQRSASNVPQAAKSAFDDRGWILFEVSDAPDGEPRRLLDISLAQSVARAMRGTLLRAVDGRWPVELSGHDESGARAAQAHLAFVPLPNVGHPHATGSIHGLALVPPRGIDANVRRALLEAVGLAERAPSPADVARGDSDTTAPPAIRLTLGRHGVVHLRRVVGDPSLTSLQPHRWTRPATRWHSVTAIALDRNPGDLRSRDPATVAAAVESAEALVAEACVHIGLPHPAAVWVRPRSLAMGAPAARRFMPFPTNGAGPRRVCVHAEIVFDRPVQGPLLLGAGRYFGVGLMARAGRAS